MLPEPLSASLLYAARLMQEVGSAQIPLKERPALVSPGRACFDLPGIGHAVIVIDLAAIFTVMGRFTVLAIVRCILQNRLVEVDDIAALTGVIGQHAPRQRIIVLAEAEEATKGQYGIFNLAR